MLGHDRPQRPSELSSSSLAQAHDPVAGNLLEMDGNTGRSEESAACNVDAGKFYFQAELRTICKHDGSLSISKGSLDREDMRILCLLPFLGDTNYIKCQWVFLMAAAAAALLDFAMIWHHPVPAVCLLHAQDKQPVQTLRKR